MNPSIEKLVSWIRTAAAGAHGLLVPISGGSDSALCFWLCRQALPGKVIGVHAGRELRALAWFERLGRVEMIETPGRHEEREEMRWARFLAINLERGYWLAGSRNHTEDLLGTYSLASRVATFLPLVNVWKSEVLVLGREIGVPDEILASSLRADPDCGRPAELAEIPITKVEAFLLARERGTVAADLTSAQAAYLDTICRRNAFKQSLPQWGPEI